MVDVVLAKKKISQIEKYLDYLKQSQGRATEAELESDFEFFLSVCYALQMLIQASIDVANHIISDAGWEIPSSYSGSIRQLEKEKVISTEVSSEIQAAAKMRNILAHQYEEISTSIVSQVLATKLKHFDTYIQDLKIWLRVSG